LTDVCVNACRGFDPQEMRYVMLSNSTLFGKLWICGKRIDIPENSMEVCFRFYGARPDQIIRFDKIISDAEAICRAAVSVGLLKESDL
jgi:hypothetical protein